ncbi:MAG: 2-amino-4-hydroxy-6-hydroxymethyldihydropteridine diphosphokinase [Corynebacterium sp.]|nr:2-amino-4-hydroxy-6-hydroxymethyldihydropteridine diphosphokinase [Corynebacterium sp.]
MLSLGSNMALAARTPRDILARAIDRLGTRCAVHAVSPLYETDAWGNTDQPNFNNCVVICETNLAPERLLDAVQQVEHEFHRIRTIHWGPRTLDVDIANLYDAATGQEIPVHTDRLTVPHPCAHERDFVLVPWADVAPDDLLGAVPVRDLLAAPTPGVRLVAEEWR